jgi:hypothetical protein
MNTSQSQRTSAGWRGISISDAVSKKRSSEKSTFMQTAEGSCTDSNLLQPRYSDSLALLCIGASQKHSVKVKPGNNDCGTECKSAHTVTAITGNCFREFQDHVKGSSAFGFWRSDDHTHSRLDESVSGAWRVTLKDRDGQRIWQYFRGGVPCVSQFTPVNAACI